MDRENLQPGTGQPGKSKDLKELTYEPQDMKIEVEIREIIRIRPQDFHILKRSFEDWIKNWD